MHKGLGSNFACGAACSRFRIFRPNFVLEATSIVEHGLMGPEPFPIRGFLEVLRRREEGGKGVPVRQNAVCERHNAVRGLDQVDGDFLEGTEP